MHFYIIHYNYGTNTCFLWCITYLCHFLIHAAGSAYTSTIYIANQIYQITTCHKLPIRHTVREAVFSSSRANAAPAASTSQVEVDETKTTRPTLLRLRAMATPPQEAQRGRDCSTKNQLLPLGFPMGNQCSERRVKFYVGTLWASV